MPKVYQVTKSGGRYLGYDPAYGLNSFSGCSQIDTEDGGIRLTNVGLIDSNIKDEYDRMDDIVRKLIRFVRSADNGKIASVYIERSKKYKEHYDAGKPRDAWDRFYGMIDDRLVKELGYTVGSLPNPTIKRYVTDDHQASKWTVAENIRGSFIGKGQIFRDILKWREIEVPPDADMNQLLELIFINNLHHITDSIACGVIGAHSNFAVAPTDELKLYVD